MTEPMSLSRSASNIKTSLSSSTTRMRATGPEGLPDSTSPTASIRISLPEAGHRAAVNFADLVTAVSGTDFTERLGVFAVGLRSEQAGWAFRELPRPDRGVDAHIEARTDGRPDGRLLALQIQSGESRFRHRISGGGASTSTRPTSPGRTSRHGFASCAGSPNTAVLSPFGQAPTARQPAAPSGSR
jgi:hypothetical protein